MAVFYLLSLSFDDTNRGMIWSHDVRINSCVADHMLSHMQPSVQISTSVDAQENHIRNLVNRAAWCTVERYRNGDTKGLGLTKHGGRYKIEVARRDGYQPLIFCCFCVNVCTR